MSDDEIAKTCSKHGELKRADIKTGIYRGKRYIKCRLCELERSREYSKRIYGDENLHEAKKQKDRDYWKEKKDEITQRRKKPEALQKRRDWHNENKERYNAIYRERQREYREGLADTYVRRIIRNNDKNLSFSAIPESMLDLKRALMALKRELWVSKKYRRD